MTRYVGRQCKTLLTAASIVVRRSSRKATIASSELRFGFEISMRPLCHDIPGTSMRLNSASTTVFVAGLEKVLVC